MPLYIGLKPIQVDIRIKLIQLHRYHAICFHGNKFTLATVKIFKVQSMVSRFQIMQTLGNNESVSTFLRNPLHTC